jgi:CRISPR/Cas system-associated endoribonuclease Cas2
MPPRQASSRLHQQDPPPQESIIPPPHNQPLTQILSAIAEGVNCPEFKDVPEKHLHQPMNTTAEVEPSQIITTSSQATERDLCQPPPQEEELDHVQISVWDEEAEEEAAAADEEELARVQEEIERLRQEQETILRMQTTMQRAEAHRQNISRERARLTETQYNLEILLQRGRESPLHNQIPNQSPPPSPPHNHILHHPNHPLQPPLPP